jgi:Skp family chaperone for outer membrane proteins
MKRIYPIFIFIFLISFNVFSDIKIDRVAIVNIEEVMLTVFSGNSKTILEIKNDKKEMQDNLDAMLQNIKKLEALEAKETDGNKKLSLQKEMDDQKKKYSVYYNTKNYQINNKIETVQGPLLKEIYNGVKAVAENEGFTIVLNSDSNVIFYYTVENDITKKVIEYFTKRYGTDNKPQ